METHEMKKEGDHYRNIVTHICVDTRRNNPITYKQFRDYENKKLRKKRTSWTANGDAIRRNKITLWYFDQRLRRESKETSGTSFDFHECSITATAAPIRPEDAYDRRPRPATATRTRCCCYWTNGNPCRPPTPPSSTAAVVAFAR